MSLCQMESLTAYCRCTVWYYPALGYCRESLTLTLCGHRYFKDQWHPWSLVEGHCTSWGPGEDQKRFLMLPCFIKLQIFSSRVIPCVNHFCEPWIKGLVSSSRRSNLEVKKKSPLLGAGELELKRECLPFMSPLYKCSCYPSQGLFGRTKFFREDVSFL
jgi:hypothetical protein